jgi:putative membrane protein
MAKFLTKVLITAIAALVASYILDGVNINSITTGFIVAIVLSLLNNFIKPILVVLTIPITIFTLGLFLIIINILIIKWAASLVDGFEVNSWWAAFLFSIIVSIVTSLLEGLIGTDD